MANREPKFYRHSYVEEVKAFNPSVPWKPLILSGCSLPPWREWLEEGELIKEPSRRQAPIDKPSVRGETHGIENHRTEANQDQECTTKGKEVDTVRWG